MNNFEFGSFVSFTLAIILLFIGKGLIGKIEILRRYGIPEPVIGGFLVRQACWRGLLLFRPEDKLLPGSPRLAAPLLFRRYRPAGRRPHTCFRWQTARHLVGACFVFHPAAEPHRHGCSQVPSAWIPRLGSWRVPFPLPVA